MTEEKSVNTSQRVRPLPFVINNGKFAKLVCEMVAEHSGGVPVKQFGGQILQLLSLLQPDHESRVALSNDSYVVYAVSESDLEIHGLSSVAYFIHVTPLEKYHDNGLVDTEDYTNVMRWTTRFNDHFEDHVFTIYMRNLTAGRPQTLVI
jgi:hypothetical protein